MATSDDMGEQIRMLTAEFDGLGKKVEGLEEKVDGLARKVDRLPTSEDLGGFKDEIINNFRMLAEDTKASVGAAAEGYVGTLDKIGRDLADLKREMVTKFSDHDQALANHNQRLVTLERRRRRTPLE